MNANIAKLYQAAGKEERIIIGLMSGTSMDGLDVALCRCRKSGPATELEVLNFITMPYEDDFRAAVKAIFSKRDADLEQVCLMNELIGITHASLILEALKKWNWKAEEVDAIASHGQSIFHAPKSLHRLADRPNGTLQIGDADHIAVKTGIITIADFRQKHIAAGGEGAPLAVYGDYLLFSKPGEDRVMLNIGGIANFTFLPGDGDSTHVFSTDVGPGNTIMDQYVQKHFPGKYYDDNAEIARKGTVNRQLLDTLLQNVFFEQDVPKTTGPELFNLEYLLAAQAQSSTLHLSHADVMATLCHFTAQGIIRTIKSALGTTYSSPQIFMSGGGMHNPLLIELLKRELPEQNFRTTAALAINPDAKEAVLFALLANETLAGKPIDFAGSDAIPAVCMGKISFPS